jgi:hypothetical protein
MARGLISQYRLAGMEFAHTPTTAGSVTHEFSQLSWWQLIEEQLERREDGGKAGWWRITGLGKQFVRNEIEVAKYAYVFDGKCLGWDNDEHASIVDALGERFDYRELMDN